MKNKVKIIHLLSHIPPDEHIQYQDPREFFKNESHGKYQKLDYPPYWVGFFIDHTVFAANDLKDITDEFEIECWRPYGHKLREAHELVLDGIKHRVFPSYSFNISQFGSLTWSSELFDELIAEISNGGVILNISVGHAWFHIKLMLKLRKYKDRFGLVALHRSGGFRHMLFGQLDTWKKCFKWFYYIESYIDALSLRYCDIYYIGSKIEADYVKKVQPKIPASFFMEGIDFVKYRSLNNYEKQELRLKLGLPINKKLLIAYGNWLSKDYGYQYLLEVFREIKKTKDGDNLELIMIGGYKSQDLYQVGVNSGAIMIEKVPKNLFINYLESSDFFTQPCFSWSFINFGGFGTAMIEALACGLPVISGNIIHFPGTLAERQQIGMDMPDLDTLKKNIIFMKDNLNKYQDCRELAKKYYNIDDTRIVLVNKYRELAKKYFGEDSSKQNSMK